MLPKSGYIIPEMGMITTEAISLSNALFSKVQQRVLGLIFGQPERSFYISEIMRKVQSGTGAVARELSRLHRSGLVSVERIGNRLSRIGNDVADPLGDGNLFEQDRRRDEWAHLRNAEVVGPFEHGLDDYAVRARSHASESRRTETFLPRIVVPLIATMMSSASVSGTSI